MLRSIIDHKKVFVLALNGPGVGGGGAWFQGVADSPYFLFIKYFLNEAKGCLGSIRLLRYLFVLNS